MSDVALLDASVLIPSTLRDTLLRAAEEELYQPLWSDQILEEVRRNLVRLRYSDSRQAERLVRRLHVVFPIASVTGYESRIREMLNHPKDRHVLAAAVNGGAGLIVTANLRHFPRAALLPHGIRAESPDTFLTNLFTAQPEALVQIIRDQSASLTRPPKSVEDIVSNLSLHAPTFASLVRRHLGLTEP